MVFGRGPDGSWFAATRDQIEAATGLKRAAQEEARRLLDTRGLIKQGLRGAPAQQWYRVVLDVLMALWAGQVTANKVVAQQPTLTTTNTVKTTTKPTATLGAYERSVVAGQKIPWDKVMRALRGYDDEKIALAIRYVDERYIQQPTKDIISFVGLLRSCCKGRWWESAATSAPAESEKESSAPPDGSAQAEEKHDGPGSPAVHDRRPPWELGEPEEMEDPDKNGPASTSAGRNKQSPPFRLLNAKIRAFAGDVLPEWGDNPWTTWERLAADPDPETRALCARARHLVDEGTVRPGPGQDRQSLMFEVAMQLLEGKRK